MTNDKECPICGNQAQRFPIIGDAEHYKCQQCKEYKISDTDLKLLKNNPLNLDERTRVSKVVANLPREDGVPLIPDYLIENERKRT